MCLQTSTLRVTLQCSKHGLGLGHACRRFVLIEGKSSIASFDACRSVSEAVHTFKMQSPLFKPLLGMCRTAPACRQYLDHASAQCATTFYLDVSVCKYFSCDHVSHAGDGNAAQKPAAATPEPECRSPFRRCCLGPQPQGTCIRSVGHCWTHSHQIFQGFCDAMGPLMWHKDQKSICALVLAIVKEAHTS